VFMVCLVAVDGKPSASGVLTRCAAY